MCVYGGEGVNRGVWPELNCGVHEMTRLGLVLVIFLLRYGRLQSKAKYFGIYISACSAYSVRQRRLLILHYRRSFDIALS